MASDFIPGKEALLGPFAQNFSDLISASPGAYGLMASDATAIAGYVSAFTAALALVLNPATKNKATVADKNGKKSAMVSIIRQYAKVIKNNLGVSNEAKIALGLHINDSSRTPVPAPTTEPILQITNSAPLTQQIRFADATTPDKKAKPPGATLLVLRVIVGTTPPAGALATPYRCLVSKQNHEITFTEADKSKTAYYYACWATAAGLEGPWSELAQQIIT